jgi:hypothetical protein
MHILREPWRRRCRPHERDERELDRGLPGERPVQLEHGGRLACGPGHDAADNLRADGIELVVDARHDAEIPAPTPQPPEKVRVLVVARAYRSCVGGHDVHGENVVRRPAPTSRQVAESAAQGESCNAGQRDEAENRGESVYLRVAIHVAEEATSLSVGDVPPWVHPYAAHE